MNLRERIEFEQTKYLMLQSYLVRHRQGWENGPTESEVMESILDWLWNNEIDPHVHKANVKKLLQQFQDKATSDYWKSVEKKAKNIRLARNK